jgi:hypothetical protein
MSGCAAKYIKILWLGSLEAPPGGLAAADTPDIEIRIYQRYDIKYRRRNGSTSPNRTVRASPPGGRLGFRKTPVGAMRLCGVLLHHILPALVFATQSPYSGWQNVAYSRHVRRHTTYARNVKYSKMMINYFRNDRSIK